MTLILALLIGVLSGLRSLTPVAATAWAVYLGWLVLDRPLSYVGSLIAVVIFTIAAVAELVADKLPTTPSRTAPPGLIARILMGALTGACVGAAGAHTALLGAVLGVVGALLGTYGGYQLRTRIVKALGTTDTVVAVAEDVVAIVGSLLVVSRF